MIGAAIWLAYVAFEIEWTIDGNQLLRRRWLSMPGSKPVAVMTLGPGLEIVHFNRYGWRLRPRGPEIRPWPRKTPRFVGAMAAAGVGIRDWRGAWASRNRWIDTMGPILQVGGAVGFVTLTLGGHTGIGFLLWLLLGLGIAIDTLPWHLRSRVGEAEPADQGSNASDR